MPFWMRAARVWLPGALVLTVACGSTYVAVQQSYRNGADDPQVQLAEDAGARISGGESPASVVPAGQVDLAVSLAPFLIVYGADDAVLAGSAKLEGRVPVVPAGVLDAARENGSNRVTWQPAPGVRIASYEVATSDGLVVLAGRSLREVERRVSQLTVLSGLAWLFGLVALFALALGTAWFEGRAETGGGRAKA